MFIKYDYIGDQAIVNAPDSAYWEIRFRLFDDECIEDYGVYLIVGDEEFTLRETDYWCQGRDIPYQAVGTMYEELVEVIAQRLAADPGLKMIDIGAIEGELVASKYEKLWTEKGYIKPDADGKW